MANCLFLYRNRIDSATMSQSSAALDGDDGSSLGASRLQDPMLSRIARTQRAESEYWRAQWPEPQAIDTVALWGHSASQNGEIDLQLYADAAFTQPLYSATSFFWPSVYGIGEAPMDEATIGGLPILTELDDYPPYTLIRLPQVYPAAGLHFGMRDPRNPAFHIDGGRLIAGRGFSPDENFEIDWTLDVDSSDKVDPLDGGGVAASRGASWRVLTISFRLLSRAEANGFMLDMRRRVRLSADLLVVPHPGQFPEESRTAIYGVFAGFSGIKKINARTYQVDMTIRELAA